MNFSWRLRRAHHHRSCEWHQSTVIPDVRFAVRRVSLGERIALVQKAMELTARNECLRAGSAAETLEAGLADLLVKRLFLEWGLLDISGLCIDGVPATPGTVAEKGPEELVDEICQVLQSSLGLSEQERKNS